MKTVLQSILRFFNRAGQLFIENPVTVIVFIWRLLLLQRHFFREAGVSPAGVFKPIGRILVQVWVGVLRGIVPVLGVGILLGYLMNQLASSVGGTVHVLFDSLLMETILRDLLALVAAVIVASRAGASIAGRFATAPAMQLRARTHPAEPFHFDEAYLYQETQRQIAAAILTAGLFYVILVYCVLAGYVTSDITGIHLVVDDVTRYLGATESFPLIRTGAAYAMTSGAITAIIASALGIRAAGEYLSGTDDGFELHTVVWESTVLSVAAGTLIVLASAIFHAS